MVWPAQLHGHYRLDLRGFDQCLEGIELNQLPRGTSGARRQPCLTRGRIDSGACVDVGCCRRGMGYAELDHGAFTSPRLR